MIDRSLARPLLLGAVIAWGAACAGDPPTPATAGTPPPSGAPAVTAEQPAAPAPSTAATPRVSAPAAGQPCPAGLVRCDQWCVDPQSDPEHCGFCGRRCELGCAGGRCQRACEYYGANVCGGDQALWCSSGSCSACETGRQNCDSTGGCECETGCNGTKCNDPECSRDAVGSCGVDPSKWCYHKDGYDRPGQCKTCSTWSHERRFNCDGLGNNGCECVSKEIYEKGVGYTGRWTHECQGGACVQIN